MELRIRRDSSGGVSSSLAISNPKSDMENGKQHTDPVVYTARGRICGIYRPSATNFLEGILLTDDGLKIPAQLTPEVASQLRANQDFLKVAQVWKCYPRIEPPWVMLVKLKSKAQTHPLTPTNNPQSTDGLRVVLYCLNFEEN